MGMAASQARFLQLTARRTNIEYQGQQINQQRLALANASAGLFEKMLSLAVPTPPSSEDDKYYTQGYIFTDSKDSVQKQIKWDTTPPTSAEITAAVGGANITVSSATNANTATVTTADVSGANGTAAQTAAINKILLAEGTTASALPAGYTQVIRNATVTHSVYDPDGKYTEVTEQSPALLEFDNLNRLISATLLKDSGTDGIKFTSAAAGTAGDKNIGSGKDLTYGGTFNQTGYADDMNKYEFQKAAYDYQVERINQETKQIQLQDKSLELKMKQLDTEHNAVQTEMEAVQKVIQKNIEGSFKTFA